MPAASGVPSCGPYRVPNVDVDSKAVFTNNPTSGAMRGFGTNQAHFAMEGIMDMLAERVGVDGYDIRERNSCFRATRLEPDRSCARAAGFWRRCKR